MGSFSSICCPILIERPILVTADGRAALGRPVEAIEQLISSKESG